MAKPEPGDIVEIGFHGERFRGEYGIALEIPKDLSHCCWVKLESGKRFKDIDRDINGTSRKDGHEWLFAQSYLKIICSEWDK